MQFLKYFRSSHRRSSVKKNVLRNIAKFTRKHLCQSLFFHKVAGLIPANLLKKRLWHRCFPENFAEFLRIPFLQNTSEYFLYFLYCRFVSSFDKLPSTLHFLNQSISYKFCGSEDKTFLICHAALYNRVTQGHMTLSVGPPYPKLPLCQV